MLRVIWVYRRSGGVLSFAPDQLADQPVFGALVHQVGVRIEPDRLTLPRAGPEGLTPAGLVLAARNRMFRLRVWRDELPGARPPRPRPRPSAPRLFVACSRTGPVYGFRAASLDEARAYVDGQHPADARITVREDAGEVAARGLVVLPRGKVLFEELDQCPIASSTEKSSSGWSGRSSKAKKREASARASSVPTRT